MIKVQGANLMEEVVAMAITMEEEEMSKTLHTIAKILLEAMVEKEVKEAMVGSMKRDSISLMLSAILVAKLGTSLGIVMIKRLMEKQI